MSKPGPKRLYLKVPVQWYNRLHTMFKRKLICIKDLTKIGISRQNAYCIKKYKCDLVKPYQGKKPKYNGIMAVNIVHSVKKNRFKCMGQ